MIEGGTTKDLNFFGGFFVQMISEKYLAIKDTGAYSVVIDGADIFLVPSGYAQLPIAGSRFSKDSIIIRPEAC